MSDKLKLSKEEQEAILKAREQQSKKEEEKEHLESFYKEFKELCDKYDVSPQLVNHDLVKIAKLLPQAIKNQQVTFVKNKKDD